MGTYKGFTSVELRKPTRSTFDLSHEKRLSGRMGKLYPVLVTETLPNDTFRGSTEVLVKLAPMIAPIFHRLNLYVHYFYMPYRPLWADFEKFITGGRLGEAVTTPPVPPRALITTILNDGSDFLDVGSLADYFGIPPIPDADTALWSGRSIDILPFLAYQKIWADYYRDRNLDGDLDNEDGEFPVASGASTSTTWYELRSRAWQHDYFTSALLTTQRGAEVLLPLEGSGDVVYSAFSQLREQDSGDPAAGALSTAGGAISTILSAGDLAESLRVENIDSVVLDQSNITINDVRRAYRLQEWLERNMLAGSRMNESIMAHFGRKTSDSRLQRAEYLGGGKAVIQISEVMTTAYSEDSDTNTIPPGNPAGRGSAYANTNSFTYNCEEWGLIIGILSVMPTSGYMQGIPRMFQQRNTFLDYPWPTFAHLGEQEVYDNEIYLDPTSLPADRTAQPLFGYQSRYADWKFISSSCHGDFRTSLDFWHLTRKFSALPTLSKAFVYFEDELQDRVFNVADTDNLWMYVYNRLTVKRALPYFGTPRT